MIRKTEPWYIHLTLGIVIVILTYILIKVAIIDPGEYVAKEEFFKNESRLRMLNLREGQILWQKKNNTFCGDLNKLVEFIKTDSMVQKVVAGIDTVTGKSSNPFVALTHGEFNADSLLFSPKSRLSYLLEVDTIVSVDTTINMRGAITKIDSTIKIGVHYVLACPDGYGKVGDKHSDALRNAISWE